MALQFHLLTDGLLHCHRVRPVLAMQIKRIYTEALQPAAGDEAAG
jgi:hypothetical protein